MYRLTTLVFLLATVFSHASADEAVQLTPALPGVQGHAIRGLLDERADDYCRPGYGSCGNGWCCPQGNNCCEGGACCPGK